ncbi:FtsJ-like methyltransferase-domain-containing protein [Cyathus striatus]|nr:FtsJ-like methyltransferase-domain-containing protein [Cyathus striatus]
MAFQASTSRLLYNTPVILKAKIKPSSREWLSRQFRDPYVKKRLSDPAAYRSRAAFKLLEIEDSWGFLTQPHVETVVDLGAAPGGWSQVVAGKLGWGAEPQKTSFWRSGLRNDYCSDTWCTHYSRRLFGAGDDKFDRGHVGGERRPHGKVDVVLSDIAANMTGNVSADVEASIQILNAVWDFAKRHLKTAKEANHREGGVLLVKHFAHPSVQEFRNEILKPHFNKVNYYKPPSSRAASSEGYFLCQGFHRNLKEDAEKLRLTFR